MIVIFFCFRSCAFLLFFFFFQAEDGIRDLTVTGVQTCALPISDPVIWRTHMLTGLCRLVDAQVGMAGDVRPPGAGGSLQPAPPVEVGWDSEIGRASCRERV